MDSRPMLHPITWLVWLAAALTSALATRNPLYLAIIVLAAATVRIAWRGPSPTALAWGVIIRLGLMLWGVTTLFDTLVAHQGATVLFALPAGWPLVGGPVTFESLLYGLISGLALTTLLITFATFNSTVNHHLLLRFTPAFMRQAGLIVSIALAFVPQMMAALQDIRRAQRLRGHQFRGMRDLLPLIVPLLGNALERAIGLAEAMEARGFASPATDDGGCSTVARRLVMLLCVLAVISGIFISRYWPEHAPAGWVVAAAGGVVFVAVWWGSSPSRKRTSYRPLRLGRNDGLVMAAGAVTMALVGGLALLKPDVLSYSPYPQAALPAFDPLIGLALLLLVMPALPVSRRAGGQGGRSESLCHPAPHLERSEVSPPRPGVPIVELQDVSYWYPESGSPAVQHLSLSIEAGEFVLVMGPSGAGKSTFLRLLNGLVPHFTGGTMRGAVHVAGRDPVSCGPEGMADAVGFVFQDPEAQFVTEQVEDELIFTLENLGYPPAEMEHRLIQVLETLDLHPLRHRRVGTLSGGERQRVAIASVLSSHPQILVLDEPTSQLDPAGAEEVLRAVTELNRQLGLTIILAEHRLERVLPYVDRLVYFPGEGKPPIVGPPRDVISASDLRPPVVELARAMGRSPLPLTVDEAKAYIGKETTSAQLGETGAQPGATKEELRGDPAGGQSGGGRDIPGPETGTGPGRSIRNAGLNLSEGPESDVSLRVSGLWCAYDGSDVPALQGVDLSVGVGEVVAMVGPNGAGKTTLLRCVMGLIPPMQGEIEMLGRDARTLSTTELAAVVGFVPQNAGAMLFTDSVQEEIAFTRRSHNLPPDGRAILDAFELAPLAEQYPWDLSVGERQRVALAAFLAAEPRLLLLDEPTRGLDYRQKARLTDILRQHRSAGRAALLVTHDVELVAAVADRMVILEDGQVIAEGPTGAVMRDHPQFASQISRLFDNGWLTAADAVAGLRRCARLLKFGLISRSNDLSHSSRCWSD